MYMYYVLVVINTWK